MVARKKNIAVDEKFFNDIFERQRKALQKQLGVTNLSQVNFTRMITGLKMKPLKKNTSITKFKKLRRKRDEFFSI